MPAAAGHRRFPSVASEWNLGLRGTLRSFSARPAVEPGNKPRVHLFGSGAILREALAAQKLLDTEFGVAADVWSATSYNLLRRDALACDRWNLLHPGEPPHAPSVKRGQSQSWAGVRPQDGLG